MPRPLTITPAPFKSSYLSIPPTPFSPRVPITPPATPPKLTNTLSCDRLKATANLLPPPSEPLHWLWQCHKCNRVYQLGVTRRCLDDGHFFCAGTTVVKQSKRNGYKKVPRHAACASEFDYSGWKAWGTWRRQIQEQVGAAEALMRAEAVMDSGRWGFLTEPVERAKGYWERSDAWPKKQCWERCDYPSECRWGKQYGVKTPVLPSVGMGSSSATIEEEEEDAKDISEAVVESDSESSSDEEEPPAATKTTFESILIDIETPSSSEYLEPLSAVSYTSNSNGQDVKAVITGETKIPSFQDIVQSAKRRRHKSQSGMPLIPSPLALNPPSPEEEAPPRRAFDDSEVERKAKGGLQMRADKFLEGFRFGRSRD